METKLLHGDWEAELQTAAALLQAGETVAFPTETVYGLGANALDETAVKKIYAAKGRPSDNPLIVHIYDRNQLAQLTDTVPEQAEKLMDAFWPGPLTIIFSRRPGAVPSCVTGGLDTVAVRMPSHPVAMQLLRLADIPVAAPSANLSGKPSPTTAQHVQHDLNGRIAAIVSGADCQVGVESTVVDLSTDTPTILRPGGITREQLEQVLKQPVRMATPHTSAIETPRAPGMKYTHYAPEAPVYICTGTPEEIVRKIRAELQHCAGTAGIMLSAETLAELKPDDRYPTVNLGSREHLEQITGNLFAALRYFDETDVTVIYTEAFPTEEIGAALMNRLNKAAGNKNV